MTENTSYRASLWRRSVSETDTDPLSSTINPKGINNYVPTDRAESNPNLSISGFIDESPFASPGKGLQSWRELKRFLINWKFLSSRFLNGPTG